MRYRKLKNGSARNSRRELSEVAKGFSKIISKFKTFQ